MRNTKYNWVLAMMMLLVLGVLMLYFFLTLSLVKYFGFRPSELYATIVFNTGPLLYVPLIIYFSRKLNVNILEIKMLTQKDIALLILLTLGILLIVYPLIAPMEFINHFRSNRLMILKLKPISLSTLLVVKFIGMVILAPIFEELFFRRLMLESMLKRYSAPVSILICSFLFALAHMRIIDFLALFTAGLLDSIVYYKTRSVLSSIITHSTWNVVILFTSIHYADSSQCSKQFIIWLVCLFIIIWIFMYFFNKTKKIHYV